MTREEAIEILKDLWRTKHSMYLEADIRKALEMAIQALEQEPETGHWKDFALWVANEIFVYEWEYNKDAFAEIACRKLAKLGIVREKDGEWELVEPQKSEKI